jgi:hypothetical protein
VGTQVVAGLVSNPKYPDIVVANKRGAFYFKHQATRSPAE